MPLRLEIFYKWPIESQLNINMHDTSICMECHIIYLSLCSLKLNYFQPAVSLFIFFSHNVYRTLHHISCTCWLNTICCQVSTLVSPLFIICLYVIHHLSTPSLNYKCSKLYWLINCGGWNIYHFIVYIVYNLMLLQPSTLCSWFPPFPPPGGKFLNIWLNDRKQLMFLYGFVPMFKYNGNGIVNVPHRILVDAQHLLCIHQW